MILFSFLIFIIFIPEPFSGIYVNRETSSIYLEISIFEQQRSENAAGGAGNYNG
jgi:hypothetical protein